MLPRYDEFYAPLLHVLKDGNTYTMKEVKKRIAENLHLPEDALLERLASGRQSVYDNRIGWAKTYLQKAGVVVSPNVLRS